MATFKYELDSKKFLNHSDFQLHPGPHGLFEPGAYFEFSGQSVQGPLSDRHHAWYITKVNGMPMRFSARTDVVANDRLRLIVETVMAA